MLKFEPSASIESLNDRKLIGSTMAICGHKGFKLGLCFSNHPQKESQLEIFQRINFGEKTSD